MFWDVTDTQCGFHFWGHVEQFVCNRCVQLQIITLWRSLMLHLLIANGKQRRLIVTCASLRRPCVSLNADWLNSSATAWPARWFVPHLCQSLLSPPSKNAAWAKIADREDTAEEQIALFSRIFDWQLNGKETKAFYDILCSLVFIANGILFRMTNVRLGNC